MAYTTYPTGRPITYTIEHRESTADSWATLDHSYLQRLEWVLAPGFHGATVIVYYGAIDGEVVAAPSLENHFVRISMTDEDAVSQTFVGYVSQIAPRRGGPVPNPLTPTETIASGDLVLTILDTAHRLSQEPVPGVVVKELNGSYTRTETPLPFNLPATRLRGQLLGNRASTPVPFGASEYYPQSVADGDTYTALDVVRHLIKLWFLDRRQTILLAGQYDALDAYEDTWDLDGDTYWDALQQLIQPTRGLTFDAATVESGEYQVIQITVYSLSDTAVLDGSTEIVPASTRQISTLNLASAQDIDDPEEHHIPAYHQVIVEGEPLRVCFTMADAYNTLADGWDYADELAMLAEAEDDRDQDAYSAVFRRFVLPPAWNGTQFIDPDYRVCLPQIDPATGLVNTALTQPVYPASLVLDDDLPLTETGTNQPRPILALHKSGDTWQRIDRGSGSRAGVHVTPLDDEPGVLLKGPKPTTLAKNHGDDAAPYDWESLYLTVSMQTLDRTRVETTVSTVVTGALERVKRIRIPDLHVWYVVQGTITDADGSSITRSAGEYARDDTATLRRIAALAVAWYGRRRTKYRIRYRRAWVMPYLGYLVANADTGAGVTPAGTVISRIVHEFRGGDGHEKQTTEFATEWHDLDIGRLFGRTARSARRNRPQYDRPVQPLLATTEGAAGYEGYEGPFAGSITGPNEITIGAHRSSSLIDNYHDTIWLGDAPFNRDYLSQYFTAPETVSVTRTVYLYYDIQVVELSTYAHRLRVTLGQSISFPYLRPQTPTDPVNVYASPRWFQVNNRHVVVLGKATVEDGQVTAWHQHQFGHIHIQDKARKLLYLEDTQKLRLWFTNYAVSSAGAIIECSVPPDTRGPIWFGYDGSYQALQVETGSGLTRGVIIGTITTDVDGKLIHLSELTDVFYGTHIYPT